MTSWKYGTEKCRGLSLADKVLRQPVWGSRFKIDVPRLRLFIADIPVWRSSSDLIPVPVGFVVDRASLGGTVLRVLRVFPCQCVSTSALNSLHQQRYVNAAIDGVVKKAYKMETGRRKFPAWVNMSLITNRQSLLFSWHTHHEACNEPKIKFHELNLSFSYSLRLMQHYLQQNPLTNYIYMFSLY